ncbi:MAG: dihydrofolate reductase [Oceanicaulis sp.]|nr:dihydrofolate reductase [Oceanicaulis sp.]
MQHRALRPRNFFDRSSFGGPLGACERAARIYLTEVDLAPKGDARFPALDPAHWREVSAERVEAAEGDDAGFTAWVLERA